MTLDELIKRMIEANELDCEDSHARIDMLFLEFIDNKEVTDLYFHKPKWYA